MDEIIITEPSPERILKAIDDSDIASIGSVISGIMRVINDPGSTAKDLKEIIELDPPLTAKILRFTNSAYFAPKQPIEEIDKAIVWLGFEVLREIALSQKASQVFDQAHETPGFSGKDLWKHSVAVALFAKYLYRREFGLRGENIYTAGLLHDIGIIAENQIIHSDFVRVQQQVQEFAKSLDEVETQLLGFDHAYLGNQISRHWNLPEDLQTVIAFHHHPLNAPVEHQKAVFSLYVADTVIQNNEIGYCDSPQWDETLFRQCVDHLSVKDHALDAIQEEVMEEMNKLEGMGLL